MTMIALAGATGLVGSAVLKLALADDRVTRVVAPSRRALPAHPKLVAPVVDFAALPSAVDWWAVDAGICALGTTRAQAGSLAAFRRIDHGYPLAFAERLRDRGAARFALVSAAGASSRSLFPYFRVKGELERDLAALDFRSLTVLRPGMIAGRREQPRRGEQVALKTLTALAAVLPRLVRINPATVIARAALEAVLAGAPGRTVVGPGELSG